MPICFNNLNQGQTLIIPWNEYGLFIYFTFLNSWNPLETPGGETLQYTEILFQLSFLLTQPFSFSLPMMSNIILCQCAHWRLQTLTNHLLIPLNQLHGKEERILVICPSLTFCFECGTVKLEPQPQNKVLSSLLRVGSFDCRGALHNQGRTWAFWRSRKAYNDATFPCETRLRSCSSITLTRSPLCYETGLIACFHKQLVGHSNDSTTMQLGTRTRATDSAAAPCWSF